MRKEISSSILLGIVIFILVIWLACERERTNPLDPNNPSSSAVLLSPPSNLTATPDYGSVMLTWNSVEGAVAYQVYRDGKQIALVESTTYKNVGLVAGITYRYQVASQHSSGLLGNKSTPVYATTIKDPRVKFSKYEITSDDNENEIVNRGEYITLLIYLQNTGTEIARGTRAVLSTIDQYIEVNNNYAEYGNLSPNQESPPLWSVYSFSVSDSCPYSHLATLTLEIKAADDYSWSDSFFVNVQQTQANIIYSFYEVTSDNNSDGNLDPGESIRILTYLKNIGTDKANGVWASLSTEDSYVDMSLNRYAEYGDLEPNQESAPLWSYYSFRLSSSTPHGYLIDFNLDIGDGAGNSWPDTFSVPVH
jgi:hypothetical protein